MKESGERSQRSTETKRPDFKWPLLLLRVTGLETDRTKGKYTISPCFDVFTKKRTKDSGETSGGRSEQNNPSPHVYGNSAWLTGPT